MQPELRRRHVAHDASLGLHGSAAPERPIVLAQASPLVLFFLGVSMPVITIAATLVTFCADPGPLPCSSKYPLISDAAARAPAMFVFSFGMMLTTAIMIVCTVFYHPWTAMWIDRGATSETWRQTLHFFNGCSTVTGILAAAAVGSLAVVPMSIDHNLHVLFVKAYFALACLWMFWLQLMLLVAPRPPQPAYLVAAKRALALGLVSLCPVLYVMHKRIVFPLLFGVPQLAYALVESACVLLTIFHPTVHLIEVHLWGARMLVTLPHAASHSLGESDRHGSHVPRGLESGLDHAPGPPPARRAHDVS